MRGAGAALLAAAVAVGATGCAGEDPAERATVLKVAWQRFDASEGALAYYDSLEAQFEDENPGVDVQMLPVVAQGNDYFTKLNLMRGAERTAPDVVVQDTFQLNADVEAGYFVPLDDHLATWDEWGQFAGSEGATSGRDGSVYAVANSTDTRGLWYNTQLFEEAGLPVPWQPRTWEEVLDAARTLKEELPDVVPFNIYASSTLGEVTAMQGVEMLLYGTPDTLYDDEAGKWVVGNQGLVDSLAFIDTVYSEELGLSRTRALDPQIQSTIEGQMLPAGELAITLDGNFIAGTWAEGGPSPWPEAEDVMAVAPMPTRDGEAPGAVSMSGGFALGVSTTAPDPDLAFRFIQTAVDLENSVEYTVAFANITVRADAAQEPEYLEGSPLVEDFTALREVTRYRPAYPEYPRVSDELQVAAEAVLTRELTPEESARRYDERITAIVGEDQVVDVG